MNHFFLRQNSISSIYYRNVHLLFDLLHIAITLVEFKRGKNRIRTSGRDSEGYELIVNQISKNPAGLQYLRSRGTCTMPHRHCFNVGVECILCRAVVFINRCRVSRLLSAAGFLLSIPLFLLG